MRPTTADHSHHGAKRNACRHLSRLIMRRSRGQALVEFALIIPTLIVILIGAGELARLAYAAIEVSNAAHAGVSYGAQNSSTAADFTGMENAAALDAQNVPGFTATAKDVCTCANGTAVSSCDSAPTACGDSFIVYVQVNTSAQFDPLFHCPGLPKTYTVRGQAMMRVE